MSSSICVTGKVTLKVEFRSYFFIFFVDNFTCPEFSACVPSTTRPTGSVVLLRKSATTLDVPTNPRKLASENVASSERTSAGDANDGRPSDVHR